MKSIATIIFSLLCGIVFGQQTNIAQNFKLYTDNKNGFSIKYPDTWNIRIPDSTENAKLFLRTPKEDDADTFIENINIITKTLGNVKISMEDIQTSIKKSLAAKLKNYQLLKDEIFGFKSADAYQIEYTCTKSSEGKEIDIIICQRLMLLEGKLFTLTYTGVVNGSKKLYNNALAIFETLQIL